jgi:alanine dehydrogenase
MNIGVPREIKPAEYRVALTPAGALELTRRGHSVLVERGAGEGSAFRDADYESVGARIGPVGQVWGESELVLKVKEPLPDEYGHLREGQVLFTYLHLAGIGNYCW